MILGNVAETLNAGLGNIEWALNLGDCRILHNYIPGSVVPTSVWCLETVAVCNTDWLWYHGGERNEHPTLGGMVQQVLHSVPNGCGVHVAVDGT